MSRGVLYICGTPIGNLDDITLRALKILKEVDIIAAEDTRRSKKLLNYYEINTDLISYHEHNEEMRSKELVNRLKQGERIALVSDAGMPCISDPGYRFVKLAREEGIKVIPIPGPTALISALVSSGFASDRFAFEGFLPRKKSSRRDYLKGLKDEERTMIFYEAPHRLVKTLKDIIEILGDREIMICRELTKKFEEKISGKISELLKELEVGKIKGEITFVLEGGSVVEEGISWNNLSILEHVKEEMEAGLSKKKAIKEVAVKRGLPKSEVYQIATKIKFKSKFKSK